MTSCWPWSVSMPSVRAMRLASAVELADAGALRSGFNALGAGDEARELPVSDQPDAVLRVSMPSVRAMRLARNLTGAQRHHALLSFQCPRCGR